MNIIKTNSLNSLGCPEHFQCIKCKDMLKSAIMFMYNAIWGSIPIACTIYPSIYKNQTKCLHLTNGMFDRQDHLIKYLKTE